MSDESKNDLPASMEVPVLAIRNTVVFPTLATPINVGRPKSLKALEASTSTNQLLGIFTQKDSRSDSPDPKDGLHQTGTLVRVVKVVARSENKFHVIIQGVARLLVTEWTGTEPCLRAKVDVFVDDPTLEESLAPRTKELKRLTHKLIHLNPGVPKEADFLIRAINNPAVLADVVASNLPLHVGEKQAVLEAFDAEDRLALVGEFLDREIAALEMAAKIESETKGEIEKNHREYFLREQLKAIRKELDGEDLDEDPDDFHSLKERVLAADMPEDIERLAMKELRRMNKMNSQSSEWTVSRTYIDWLIDLPWSVYTKDNLDIKNAEQQLDEDHYGLEKVKDRILEYLAVRKIKEDMKGPILCLVGPPGVGKTSLAQSVADALGREMVRIALGGVRDEADVRGHRRTYIGALPGRFIKGIKKAGTRNPVVVLDEIDKLSSDHRGDPSSALLEVLDPEQNNKFEDHYLDVPFDLSKCLFIATANSLGTIQKPLLDRMEVIEIPGYTIEDKVRIAQEFIIPEQLDGHGINCDHATLTEEGLRFLIESYTREAGVRGLKREVGSLFRRVARDVASEDWQSKQVITPEVVEEIRGPVKYINDLAEQEPAPGVVCGLAWTAAGGDVLFVEANKMPGEGKVKITGRLGDVMKESVEMVSSVVRAACEKHNISKSQFKNYDYHVHFPQGAIPKDGPSAGAAIFTAILSCILDKPVRCDVAMTGETCLREQVLPIGGVKEKCMAAHRAGIKKVLLPERNRKDLPEVPDVVKNEVEIVFVKTLDEVLEHALV